MRAPTRGRSLASTTASGSLQWACATNANDQELKHTALSLLSHAYGLTCVRRGRCGGGGGCAAPGVLPFSKKSDLQRDAGQGLGQAEPDGAGRFAFADVSNTTAARSEERNPTAM